MKTPTPPPSTALSLLLLALPILLTACCCECAHERTPVPDEFKALVGTWFESDEQWFTLNADGTATIHERNAHGPSEGDMTFKGDTISFSPKVLAWLDTYEIARILSREPSKTHVACLHLKGLRSLGLDGIFTQGNPIPEKYRKYIGKWETEGGSRFLLHSAGWAELQIDGKLIRGSVVFTDDSIKITACLYVSETTAKGKLETSSFPIKLAASGKLTIGTSTFNLIDANWEASLLEYESSGGDWD